MALVVEDGTGKADAQSYISVADADAYFLARGNSSWAAAVTASKEAALCRATMAIDGNNRFRGYKASAAQALAWPRSANPGSPFLTNISNFYPLDDDGYELSGIPTRLKLATAEAAVIELAESGVLTQAQDRGGRVKQETIGPLTTVYADGAPAETAYPAIQNLLRPLLNGSSHSVRIGRG